MEKRNKILFLTGGIGVAATILTLLGRGKKDTPAPKVGMTDEEQIDALKRMTSDESPLVRHKLIVSEAMARPSYRGPSVVKSIVEHGEQELATLDAEMGKLREKLDELAEQRKRLVAAIESQKQFEK